MTVGALAYSQSEYFLTRNMPADPIGRSASAAQAPSRAKADGKTAFALTPLNPETARKTKIYSANRVQVNEHMFDHAPLTRSAAHMRARARIAMSNLPSSMPRAAAAPQSAPQSAPTVSMSAHASAPEASTEGGKSSAVSGGSTLAPQTGCGTCESRVYQDGSDDPGVSFQSPKGMSASLSGIAVAAHEGEHVTRESAKALEEGNTVTQKKVTMQVAFCPECHRMYYSGGATTITTVASEDKASGLTVKSAAETLENLGNAVDLYI